MNLRRFARKLMMRNESGFGLPTIVCLGVCAAFVLYASSQLLTRSMGKIAGERLTDVMRASAESGLDWGVEQLSNTGTKASVDTGATVEIPTAYLHSPPGTTLSGTITVTRQDAPSTSYLYNSNLDSQSATTQTGGQVEWRIVTARVTNGVRTKSVRVMLKPVYSPYTISTTGTALFQGAPVPYFTKALFAPGVINFSGNNAMTDSYDSAIAGPNPTQGQMHEGTAGHGDVGSNTGVALGNGDVNGTTTVTAGAGNGSVTVGSNGSSTNGVQTSGTASGVPSGSVTTLTGSDATPQFIPDAPTAPAGSTNLGSISLSGNHTQTISQPGNYVVSSLSIAGNGQLIFPSTGIVNLYVQGSGASISIAGNGIATPSGYPSNVRIWYGGSTDVNITGNGDMKAVIMAPNAAVNFKGNGAMYGAAIGKTVNITGNGAFHYDEALGRSVQLTYIPPVTVITTTVSTTFNFSRYQAVSWMEF
jgi:hypothetical protein